MPDQAPEAEHEVAFVADQAMVEELPEFTVLGLAWSDTTGAEPITVTVADWVAEPPGPVQVTA